jgi:BlaI family transcriptional regulator, penicillinase repressor
MGRPVSEHPTELEMRILKILWERSPLPVRDVRAALAEQGRGLAHTSVITTLNRMVGKRYLVRVMRGKEFLFSPAVEQREVRQRMLGDLVRRVFDGSPAAVVLSLLDVAEVDEQELEELRQIIGRKTDRAEEV